MRKPVSVFAFVVLLVTTAVFAQTGATIHGRVTASSDGSALPGVTVSIEELHVTAVTDAEGRYTISVPDARGESVTVSHISSLTDAVILLRYVEMFGELRRGLTVLKMRGSGHDKEIREYTIDGKGLHIGAAFRGVAGILSGTPQYVASSEIQRIRDIMPG